MGFDVFKVQGRRDLDRFVRLPWAIYKDDPAWVPPLILERKEHLDPRKNPFFEHGEAAYFLAMDGSTPVGRISAHVNRLHNERYNDRTGFFGFFECIDNQQAADALLREAEEWLLEKNMAVARGPMSFSINDEVGVLVEGFEHPPKFLMGHNPRYYDRLLSSAGYVKVKDLFAWDYYTGEVAEIAAKVAERMEAVPGLVVREVRPDRIKEEVGIIMDIFNSAWARNWGFLPFTKSELDKLAKDLKLILDPRLALIAEYNGQPIAISIAFPDLNQMIKDLDGRLFPFGIFKLLYRVKRRRYTDARLALLGIKKEFRGGLLNGLSAALYVQMHRRGKAMGLRGGELGWTLEDNERINRGIELMGGRAYKRYRIYDRSLAKP